jgi:hypothetical protein
MSSSDDDIPLVELHAKKQADGHLGPMEMHPSRGPSVRRGEGATEAQISWAKRLRKGPSDLWKCDEGHHIAQCTCKLDEKYEKFASSTYPKIHDEAVAYNIAYLDWFHKDTPDLDITGRLMKIKHHHGMSIMLLKDGLKYD